MVRLWGWVNRLQLNIQSDIPQEVYSKYLRLQHQIVVMKKPFGQEVNGFKSKDAQLATTQP